MCIVHLLREINFLIELYPQNDWIKNLKILLKSSIELKHSMLEKDYNHSAKRDEIEKRLEELLKIPPGPINKKIIPIHKRLVKNRGSIFTFLYYFTTVRQAECQAADIYRSHVLSMTGCRN